MNTIVIGDVGDTPHPEPVQTPSGARLIEKVARVKDPGLAGTCAHMGCLKAALRSIRLSNSGRVSASFLEKVERLSWTSGPSS